MCSLNLHLQVELASRQLQLQEMSQASTRSDENRWWENAIFCKISWWNLQRSFWMVHPPEKWWENGSIHHIFFRIRVGSTTNWKMIFSSFTFGIPWSHLQLRRRPLQSSKRTDRRRWRRCNVNSANGKYRSPRGAGMWSPSFCETWLLTFKDPEIRCFSFKVVFFAILLTIFVPNKPNTSSLGGFGWRKFLCSAWDRAWGSKAASRAREAATREAAEQATAVAAKNPLGN